MQPDHGFGQPLVILGQSRNRDAFATLRWTTHRCGTSMKPDLDLGCFEPRQRQTPEKRRYVKVSNPSTARGRNPSLTSKTWWSLTSRVLPPALVRSSRGPGSCHPPLGPFSFEAVKTSDFGSERARANERIIYLRFPTGRPRLLGGGRSIAVPSRQKQRHEALDKPLKNRSYKKNQEGNV